MTLRLADSDADSDPLKSGATSSRADKQSDAASHNGPLGRIGGLSNLVRGAVVSYVGHLGQISEPDFIALIEKHGGRFGVVRGRGIMVVGAGDWPLADPAAMQNQLSLIERVEKNASGSSDGITAIGEHEFLSGLGAIPETDHSDDSSAQLFSTARLVELLGISRERLRTWVCAGLITPAKTELGVWYFDFREVTAARTLCDLAATGVSAEKIRQQLQRLCRWVPGLERPLHQLSVIEAGKMVIRLDAGEMVDPDGQLQFEFGAQNGAGIAGTSSTGLSSLRLAPGPRTAADWLAQGLQQEREGFLEEAAASYREALLAGGPDAQTCLNLGNVLRALGSPQQALERYAQATEVDPHFADAWNNLGTLLAELGRPEEAISAFQRILASDPSDARAHYNLADALEDLGRSSEAQHHWRAYLATDTTSAWGIYARGKLAR